ncbi:efflux RND transporter periplasmic adaptor subunit [Rheinheimera sp. D18]|uniref:efflux RND transporter periplasmic adaptor subunit n=1 Tax=Rheinheimera sp. D18 TaxID=2545632 RepID=UPI001045FD3E|nr:efflux RND transporter periplasmic adaptor subunit [Rheinheimera sp. D18]QBL08340.1 efflux RND transporter periplasmic adaptor subunit [Rheinheimera sp. D18]
MNKLIIAAIITLPLVLSGCGEAPAPRQKTAAAGIENLQRVNAEHAQINDEIELDGIIEAVNRAVVSAQTSGRVLALPFDVGDVVLEGEVIAGITDTEQQAALSNAKAQLAEAQARFMEADQQLKRIKDVFERGVVSKAEFDQAKAAQKTAAARVESGKAAINNAEQGLVYTQIRAPYSGILVQRLVDVGATVAPGTPLLEGVSLKDLRVEVDIPEHYIVALRQHNKARIILNNGASITAKSLRIPPSANAATHSFRTLLELPEAEHEQPEAEHEQPLFPGTLVKVAFAIGNSEQILLPNSAIAKRAEISAVYVFNGAQQLEFRYVRTGKILADDKVVILSGLQHGEQVALDTVAAASVYKTQRFAAQDK